MKKALIILIALFAGLLTTNCNDYEITPTHELTVNVSYPDGFIAADFPEDVTVKAFNTDKEKTTTVTAGTDGKAIFDLSEGNYKITTSFSVTGNDDEEYIFNGTVSEYTLTENDSTSMTLILANTGGFVFKEIYYSGSRTPANKTYFHDQFHEIYNNTGAVLYADGLCIAALYPTTSNRLSSWANEDGSLPDSLPTYPMVWIIPGDGDDYPINPGENIVIAMDGINHQNDENGNPDSPVNLSNANWETYFELSGKDLDASGVPNLTLVYTTSTKLIDFFPGVYGPAEIIFKFPDNDWESFVGNPNNFMTRPGSSSSTEYLMIPKEYVIDAVECVRTDKTVYKRLPNDLDAGYTYIEAGTYSSKSVRRKVKKIIDGRVIYKDTNNSSEDFLHDLTPTPGINPESVEE